MTHNKNPAQRAGAGGAKGNSHQSASYTKRRRSDKDAIHRHLIRITLFADKAAKRMQQCDKTLLQLRDDVMRSTAATKAKLPWIKLATFGDVLSDKKSLRHNANVKSISGVELDYDGEVIGIADAVALLGKLNCRGLLYSSPSHTTRAPRWRVLFPTSKALEPGHAARAGDMGG